jgi:glycosyltransferase involved in cell wall biosynthesis
MGVRVVTTPAGGAPECLIDGVTGHVLESADNPDLETIVDRTRDLALQSANRELFAEGGAGREFLDSRFSIPHMLAQFVTCTSSGLGLIAGSKKASAPSCREAA